ncbi:gene transfer agent family protein [Methylobacterium isbiliense]|jgi:hypothetical protein|uniref:Gene transfer agent family protein n=1 Tax=Methylobacterium isbiliense TaxID=315478 RepID=A0ABQ4SEF3_9HYPH|nr:gene transfer agent family protein [Methylobacterium isbiliense]MDN3621468.1 gene transfer agent family protein [Methylobacterium isbiliense]GJE00895.1 hypothetical protein GMJLKIPL_2822 [Methylobacterium isbiliense]
MIDTSVTAFVGDRERPLALTPPLILELERTTGAGIGALVRRVLPGDFHMKDTAEVVRLALIGGGAEPAEAAALVETYVTARPLHVGHELATLILMALWSGKPAPAPQADPDAAAVLAALAGGAA